jgi:hypothetical protein
MEYLVVLGFQPYDLFVAPIEMLTAGRGGHSGGGQAGRLFDVATEGANW